MAGLPRRAAIPPFVECPWARPHEPAVARCVPPGNPGRYGVPVSTFGTAALGSSGLAAGAG